MKPQKIWSFIIFVDRWPPFPKSQLFRFPALWFSGFFFVPFWGVTVPGSKLMQKIGRWFLQKWRLPGPCFLLSKYWTLMFYYLAGGFRYFLFSPLVGEDFQFDYMIYIFQTGWNHQPANLWVVFFGGEPKKWCLKLGASEMHRSKKIRRGDLGLRKKCEIFVWLNLSCARFWPLWDDNYSPDQLTCPRKINGWKM